MHFLLNILVNKMYAIIEEVMLINLCHEESYTFSWHCQGGCGKGGGEDVVRGRMG